mmetsp:Transcript_55384/g.81416  ORF Transcript_55384/g.81416 Transcript_55384/m.81416 type:complete len:99 (+) Transcript_55384:2-298(+)
MKIYAAVSGSKVHAKMRVSVVCEFIGSFSVYEFCVAGMAFARARARVCLCVYACVCVCVRAVCMCGCVPVRVPAKHNETEQVENEQHMTNTFPQDPSQ